MEVLIIAIVVVVVLALAGGALTARIIKQRANVINAEVGSFPARQQATTAPVLPPAGDGTGGPRRITAVNGTD